MLDRDKLEADMKRLLTAVETLALDVTANWPRETLTGSDEEVAAALIPLLQEWQVQAGCAAILATACLRKLGAQPFRDWQRLLDRAHIDASLEEVMKRDADPN